MLNNLWLRWITAFSVFCFCHFIYLSMDGNLTEADRNVYWYGLLTVLDVAMGITLIYCRFKPISSLIAWLCFASALMNIGFGTYHYFSDATPLLLDDYVITLYTSLGFAITAVQLLLFIMGAEEIGTFARNHDHSIYALFDAENNPAHDRDMAR